MDQRANFLALILLDALEDGNEGDVLKILEKNCVDASFVPRDRGIAPLHYACGMDNERLAVDITRCFLKSGADPNVRTDENMTPLHVAAMYGRAEIVRMLLEYGAKWDVVDDERKTPVLYAIEECHFEVVQIMRDHIFVDKYEQKRQQEQQQHQQRSTSTQLEHTSMLSKTKHQKTLTPKTSTPLCADVEEKSSNPVNLSCANKNLLSVSNSVNDSAAGKYTPNRIHYNYDVTSPYYINITHRRHNPQPKFPAMNSTAHQLDENGTLAKVFNISAEERTSSPEITTHPVNIFSLTKENVNELSQITSTAERSRLSLIEMWREKVQRSRARQSILKQYDDIGEMIDNVIENEHLNFTNTVLNEKDKNIGVESGTGGCISSSSLENIFKQAAPLKTISPKCAQPNISLGTLIQKVAQANLFDSQPQPAPMVDTESSYQTVPEIMSNEKENINQPQQQQSDIPANTSNFIRSPNSGEYFLQMTEAYVHTDDENGLVFYETKLLSNHGNKVSQQRCPIIGLNANNLPTNLDTTDTSQSTNLTVPFDYETDALRAELTTFGEQPGPITKSTKRLYIKRLVKYKRKTAQMLETKLNQGSNEIKFSVELNRTVRSIESFQRIPEYMKYEDEALAFFSNRHQNKKMREGHLKQSFIYMLIDPRISCNLSGESAYLEKFDIWKRFLDSIFYVGKGKTSRPYSHLYDAMKTHSRINDVQLNKNGKKCSIRKQPLNLDLFKSPPTKSLDNKKLDRILDIWGNGNGVVCLHVFHNIVPTEAYTREAAMIDALSLKHLTNVKRGDYYGPIQTWTMKEKKYLGIALLYKAMKIYLAEGESQLSPSDLI